MENQYGKAARHALRQCQEHNGTASAASHRRTRQWRLHAASPAAAYSNTPQRLGQHRAHCTGTPLQEAILPSAILWLPSPWRVQNHSQTHRPRANDTHPAIPMPAMTKGGAYMPFVAFISFRRLSYRLCAKHAKKLRFLNKKFANPDFICIFAPANKAQMAESVDALVSNTSGAIHPGSIPGLGTRKRAKYL